MCQHTKTRWHAEDQHTHLQLWQLQKSTALKRSLACLSCKTGGLHKTADSQLRHQAVMQSTDSGKAPIVLGYTSTEYNAIPLALCSVLLLAVSICKFCLVVSTPPAVSSIALSCLSAACLTSASEAQRLLCTLLLLMLLLLLQQGRRAPAAVVSDLEQDGIQSIVFMQASTYGMCASVMFACLHRDSLHCEALKCVHVCYKNS